MSHVVIKWNESAMDYNIEITIHTKWKPFRENGIANDNKPENCFLHKYSSNIFTKNKNI